MNFPRLPEYSTAPLHRLLTWLTVRIERHPSPYPRLVYLAAVIEAEMDRRARVVHPDAVYDGTGFVIAFRFSDRERNLFAAPEDFDALAALVDWSRQTAKPATSRPRP